MIKADRIVTSTCPYCGVGCTLQLHVKDDYIFKVTSPFDSPVNHGNLCVKGCFGYDYAYHPRRVTTPLVRRYLLERKSIFDIQDSRSEGNNALRVQNFELSNNELSTSPWDWIETDWNTAL